MVIVFRDDGIAGTSDCTAAAACCTGVGGGLVAVPFVAHLSWSLWFATKASLARVIAPPPQRGALVLVARWRLPFRRSAIIVIVFRDEGIAGTSDFAAAARCCTGAGVALAASLLSLIYLSHCVPRRKHRWYE